jgi:L-asparaginase II
MTRIPGLLSKSGWEGVHAVALPDGRAFALKADDGSPRAALALIPPLLELLGASVGDLTHIHPFCELTVQGGGETVGEVRARAGVLDRYGIFS